jgi:dihydroflavonol-4-reductase
MQAFVTGGTGLLGTNLIRHLVSQGHEVRALVRSTDKARRQFADLWEPWRGRLTFVEGDLAEVGSFTPALAGSDVVFHTAAYFREYYQPGDHWAMLEALNVHATQRLLEAAEQHGVRRVVHVSTSGVIGMGSDGAPGDESTPPTPQQMRNLYFRSKYLADWMIDTFERASRLEVVTVHPGWMFGPGDAAPTSAGTLVLQFLRREVAGVPDGGINVVDARDVAAGVLAAAERAPAGAHYIIGGPFVTAAEIFATLERVSGIRAPRRRMPPRLLKAIAWVGETVARLRRRPAALSLEGVRMLHLKARVSSARAERELGATFRPLDETLRDAIRWFTTQGMIPASLAGSAIGDALPEAAMGQHALSGS